MRTRNPLVSPVSPGFRVQHQSQRGDARTHASHVETSAERIFRVSFLPGTHRSLPEQKSRRGYCWRGGERKRRKEQGRAPEEPALAAAAGTQEGLCLEGLGRFSSLTGPLPWQCRGQRNFGFQRSHGNRAGHCFLLTGLLVLVYPGNPQSPGGRAQSRIF